MRAARALLPALLLGAATAQSPIKTSLDTSARVTIPFDQSLRPFSQSLPLSAGNTAFNATGNQPTQIHLSIAGPDSYFVLWATGQPVIGTGPKNDPSSVASVVKYAPVGQPQQTATGTAAIYNQIYNETYAPWGGATAQNYSSPILHSVVLQGLQPNTKYNYQVGDGTTFGNVLSFTTLQRPGPSYPQRLLAIADWGASSNSSTTLDHIVGSAVSSPSPPLTLFIGDFCYADTWHPNGTDSGTPTSSATSSEGNPSSGTYQAVWDTWQRLIAPLTQQVPMIGAPGNHEIEINGNDGSRTFVSVQARWPTPPTTGRSTSSNYFYYSVDAGPVHNIMLNNYVDYTPGSGLYNWLQQDLQSIDRTVTPWVTVSFHNPWYTTDYSYKEFEQMRISLEPLLYKYGADVFFYGHVHSYERSHPVYNYTVDQCGSIHLTIGDAGNTEGLSGLESFYQQPIVHQYEDLNGGCQQPNLTTAFSQRPSYLRPLNPSIDHFAYYNRTITTFNGDGQSAGPLSGNNNPGYCYAEQPPWSAYRESSFGHGVLDVVNETHALWQWHRNQDSEAVITDEIYLVRDPVKCPNKAGAPKPQPPPREPQPHPLPGHPEPLPGHPDPLGLGNPVDDIHHILGIEAAGPAQAYAPSAESPQGAPEAAGAPDVGPAKNHD